MKCQRLRSFPEVAHSSFVLPLLRYRLNDYSSISPVVCECGRGLPLMGEVKGRNLNLLTATDGSFVHGGYLFYIIEEMLEKGMGHMQVQAVQDSYNHIELNIVESDLVGSPEIEYFVNKFRIRLGQDMQFSVKKVKKLERERSGKLWITKNKTLLGKI